MTDIQRIWLSTVIQKEHREVEKKSRLEALRARVFGKRGIK
jgi:hypothetical protein